jgi:hypothetical protein
MHKSKKVKLKEFVEKIESISEFDTFANTVEIVDDELNNYRSAAMISLQPFKTCMSSLSHIYD